MKKVCGKISEKQTSTKWQENHNMENLQNNKFSFSATVDR